MRNLLVGVNINTYFFLEVFHVQKNKLWHCSLAFCVLSLSLLLCNSFGICFAADSDWQLRPVSPSSLGARRYIALDGKDYFPASDEASWTPASRLTWFGVEFSNLPSTDAFSLSGTLAIVHPYTSSSAYENVDTVTPVYGYITYADGTRRRFDYDSFSVGKFTSVEFSVSSNRGVKSLIFYFRISFAHPSEAVVYRPNNFISDSNSSLVMGSGSSLSPTYPSFDNSVNSAAGGVVSGYNQLEGDLMGGVASGLSDADDLVTNLPDRFTDYLDGFNFWRDIFNAAFREPFLSFLVMVSLSVGVFCIILKILPKVR